MDLVLRLLHILPAIFLAGGVFFMWAALLPAMGSAGEDTKKAVLDAVRGKWSKVVMISSALLLVSGLINAVNNIVAFEYTSLPYHMLVTLKLILGIGIMFITARLSGRSASAEKFREKAGFWLGVSSAMLVVLIVVASTMRVAERVPKPAEENEPTAAIRVDSHRVSVIS